VREQKDARPRVDALTAPTSNRMVFCKRQDPDSVLVAELLSS
jgi:hypothetical protein